MAITIKDTPHLWKFLISAKSPKGFKKKYMVLTVDMSNIHERECEHNKNNPDESDYESWIPHTADEGGCLDGREIVMVRKKPDWNCYNPDNFNLFFIKDYCLCTNDDYHCDYGFKKDE